jgi:hypothetical protein
VDGYYSITKLNLTSIYMAYSSIVKMEAV